MTARLLRSTFYKRRRDQRRVRTHALLLENVRVTGLQKIISGGQTGIDRGALDAALERAFPCGGFCPADRSAEDGPIPSRYPLKPLSGAGYSERTLQNVLESDGTVILSCGPPTGGTAWTRTCCERYAKPCLVMDAAITTAAAAAPDIRRFVIEHGIRVLNVAGPRASQWPAGHALAQETIRRLLELEAGATRRA